MTLQSSLHDHALKHAAIVEIFGARHSYLSFDSRFH